MGRHQFSPIKCIYLCKSLLPGIFLNSHPIKADCGYRALSSLFLSFALGNVPNCLCFLSLAISGDFISNSIVSLFSFCRCTLRLQSDKWTEKGKKKLWRIPTYFSPLITLTRYVRDRADEQAGITISISSDQKGSLYGRTY